MARKWTSLASVFGTSKSRTAEAQLRLTQAYRAVFTGSPSRQDQELVLADFLSKSGFNRVLPSQASDAELRQNEGKRELYGTTVFAHLSLAPDDLAALENAARLEAAIDAEE